jgi:hypothetical protein
MIADVFSMNQEPRKGRPENFVGDFQGELILERVLRFLGRSIHNFYAAFKEVKSREYALQDEFKGLLVRPNAVLRSHLVGCHIFDIIATSRIRALVVETDH